MKKIFVQIRFAYILLKCLEMYGEFDIIKLHMITGNQGTLISTAIC